MGAKGIPRRTVKGDTRKTMSVPGTEGLEQIRKLQDTHLQKDEMNRIVHVLNVLIRDLGSCPR